MSIWEKRRDYTFKIITLFYTWSKSTARYILQKWNRMEIQFFSTPDNMAIYQYSNYEGNFTPQRYNACYPDDWSNPWKNQPLPLHQVTSRKVPDKRMFIISRLISCKVFPIAKKWGSLIQVITVYMVSMINLTNSSYARCLTKDTMFSHTHIIQPDLTQVSNYTRNKIRIKLHFPIYRSYTHLIYVKNYTCAEAITT